MATCPRCGESTRGGGLMVLEPTGGFIAEPPGPYSLAGVQFKAEAQPEYRLTCRCRWSVVGRLDGGELVEDPPGQTPETSAGRLAGIPGGIVRLVEAGDLRRAEQVRRVLGRCTEREQRLIREAAVMGFVLGTRAGPGCDIPADSATTNWVVDSCLGLPDLYPAFAMVAGGEAGGG